MSLTSQALQTAKQEGYACLVKKTVRYIFTKIANTWPVGYARVSMSRHKLRKSLIRLHELDDIIDFAFSFRCLGISITPAQVKWEIEGFLRLLYKLRLETVLEIGTENGGTLFLFSRIASSNAALLSIDLPEGSFGGGYPKWKMPLYKSFAREKQEIHLIRADSHDPTTLGRVKQILAHRKVDFLFIDGDHSYEGVKKDFQMYGPLVRKGGIIAFHDIVPGAEENVGGVPKLWLQIKTQYNYQEIVKNWEQGGFGISVLFA
jgi:cephalosporin hydroxylase